MKRLGEGTFGIILQTRESLRLQQRILKVAVFSPVSPTPLSEHTHTHGRSAEMSRTSTLLDNFANLGEVTVPFVMSQRTDV